MDGVFQAVNRRVSRLQPAQLQQMAAEVKQAYDRNVDEMSYIGISELGNNLEDDRVIMELKNVETINLYLTGVYQRFDNRGNYLGVNDPYPNLRTFLQHSALRETARRYNIAKRRQCNG